MIELYNVNFLNPSYTPLLSKGGILREFVVQRDDRHRPLPERFADMCAQYYLWITRKDIDIVGFQGYRKHLYFKNDRAGWEDCDIHTFLSYQKWLSEWSGDKIRWLLKKHNIIVTPPFDLKYNVDISEDYRRSRSSEDWDAFMAVMGVRAKFDWHLPFVRNFFFVTTNDIFQEWMTFWWDVCFDLDPLVKSEDTDNEVYKKRPMAYLSERMFTLWLEYHRKQLCPVEVPLLTCWDAH